MLKCPKCGAGNLDTAESCSSCGVKFRRMQTIKTHVVLKHPKEMKRRTLNRLVLLPLGVSLAVAVSALLVAVLLFSSWLSPLATVRDADGDGYPDAYDFVPDDPEMWAEGDALIVVMLHSSHTFSTYNYSLYVDGVLQTTGQIAANQTKVENIEVSFAIGKTNQKQVVLGLVATDGSSEQRQLTLENGNGYEADFTIPYSSRR